MRRSLERNIFGLVLASALGLAVGCAKDPTELILTLTVDGTPARPITAFKVTLDAAGVKTSRGFVALALAPADADIGSFTFPATIRYLIPSGTIGGVVDVSVEGGDSDPITSATLLATGTGQALVQDQKTTSATIALDLISPPNNGGNGGAGGAGGGAGGAGGGPGGGGGAIPDGMGGTAGQVP